jgi:hypothetical protein
MILTPPPPAAGMVQLIDHLITSPALASAGRYGIMYDQTGLIQLYHIKQTGHLVSNMHDQICLRDQRYVWRCKVFVGTASKHVIDGICAKAAD